MKKNGQNEKIHAKDVNFEQIVKHEQIKIKSDFFKSKAKCEMKKPSTNSKNHVFCYVFRARFTQHRWFCNALDSQNPFLSAEPPSLHHVFSETSWTILVIFNSRPVAHGRILVVTLIGCLGSNADDACTGWSCSLGELPQTSPRLPCLRCLSRCHLVEGDWTSGCARASKPLYGWCQVELVWVAGLTLQGGEELCLLDFV